MASGSVGVGSPTAAATLVPLQEVHLMAVECMLRVQREAELLTLETSEESATLRRRAGRLVSSHIFWAHADVGFVARVDSRYEPSLWM